MQPLVLLVFLAVVLFPSSTLLAQSRGYARVISENANLREAPSVGSPSQQEVPEGTLVKVLDRKLPWYVVRVRDTVGWMHGNTLEFVEKSNPSAGETENTPKGSPSTTPREKTSPRKPRNKANALYGETIPAPPTRIAPTVRTTPDSRSYITGPRGGCYYYSGPGRKVYVDHSLCN